MNKILPTDKSQKWSAVLGNSYNIQRRTYTYPQTIPKIEDDGTLRNSFYEAIIASDTKKPNRAT